MEKYEEMLREHGNVCSEAYRHYKKMQKATSNFIKHPNSANAFEYFQQYLRLDGICDIIIRVDIELFGKILKVLDNDLFIKALEVIRW